MKPWTLEENMGGLLFNLSIGNGFTSQSVSQFSRSVVSYSLRPHESQHARLPCPSPTPRVHSDSRPSSWWCHPAISSSVVPFTSCPQSLPASESFPMSQLFAWGGQVTFIENLLISFLLFRRGSCASFWNLGTTVKIETPNLNTWVWFFALLLRSCMSLGKSHS